ncbi:hypothetical protein H6F93_20745 [Leptolyngbya sp. FACHB-671]|uniref:hypothetical protein n=1 Tax=Leptolyngbya sp. FACHB-671 TaxID=2692812 RepID=UPI001682D4D3|nr:hypothetical protein [Leptolyngbya sp. FACHB-671]MBD1870419.1 hypothetical protein [Cyanobacteria bacterium FACHB-471]MBD2069914.1 hypothetical protein [Leptolyngbya sp. FACHB-671]
MVDGALGQLTNDFDFSQEASFASWNELSNSEEIEAKKRSSLHERYVFPKLLYRSLDDAPYLDQKE